MKKFLSILIGIALVLTCSFSNCQFAFADAKPKLELKYSVKENQTLDADKSYTAEVWLYNVENVKSGAISLNGQKSKFGDIAGTATNGTDLSSAVDWNAELSYKSKAFKTSVMPTMAKDEITFTMEKAISVGSDGLKLATITVANTTKETASLQFGGWGTLAKSIAACILKDDSENQIYSTNNKETFDIVYTWATGSGGSDEQPWDSTWSSFRGNPTNNAVVEYATPKGEATTALKWVSKQGSGYTNNVSPALLIGDYVYVTSTTQLLRINKTTGEVEKTCDLNETTQFNTVSPAYGIVTINESEKGVVFVSLTGGMMQAINAETMKTLWTSESACNGQNQCPVLYDDNTKLVYTGYWSSESGDAAYVCLDAKTGELKWKHDHRGGFYWAGGLIDGNYLVVGSDNGDDGSGEDSQTNDHDLSTLYVFDKQTGAVKDSRKKLVGDQRSTIVKYNNKYYFTTKGGYLYKAEIDANGKITTLVGKTYGNGQSTSTPVIYNERVYFGFGGGFGNSGQQFVVVANANSLEEIYRAPMPGYPQGSGLLSTAYKDTEEGTVYIYFTYNYPPGGVVLLKDKTNQTTPNVEKLYVPGEGLTQYCLSSVIADTDGTLYYHNDSGALFALEKNEAYLKNITLSDNGERSIELLKSKGDASSQGFSQGYLNYYAVAEESVQSVKFSFDKPDGASVKINNDVVSGETFTLNLTDAQQEVNIEVIKGDYKRTYTVTIKKASTDTSLSILGLAATTGLQERDYSVETIKNATPTTYGLLEPNLSPEGSDYTIGRIHCYENSKMRLDIRPNNSGATFKLRAKDRTQIKNANLILDDEGYFSNVKSDWQYKWTNNYGVKDEEQTKTWYYELAPADNIIEEDINLILTVTAEDGKTTKDYNITVKIDRKAPEVKSAEVNKKSDGSLVFNLDIGEKGKLYYVLKDTSEQPPERGDILKGTEIALSEGINEISIEQGSQGKKIYYMLKDEIENLTGINAITIPKSPNESVANKISVSFRLIGSTHTQAGKSVDLSKGKEGYYGAEYQTWIATKTYTLEKGSTVYDLFKKATDEAGIQSIGAEKDYVETIYAPKVLGGEALSAFTNGQYSGWMYTVNGNHPNVGLKNYALQNGESVVWHYVNDYRYEPADWSTLGGTAYPAASDTTFHNEWLKAPDRVGGSGGGNPTTTDTKTVTTDTTSGAAATTAPTETKVTEKVNADGTKEKTVAVTVSADNQTEIIKQAADKKSTEIVLEVASTATNGAQNVQLQLNVSFVKNVSEKTDAALTVNTENGTVSLDQDTIKTVLDEAKGATITLDVNKVANPTEIQKKAAGESGQILSLTVKSGDKTISDFKTGKVTVTVAISTALQNKRVAAIHIAEDGKIEQMPGKSREVNGKKCFEFTTSHFSDFALVDADELGLETEEEIDAAALVAKLTPVARSAKTAKGYIKVTTNLDKNDKAIISQLTDAGYTVKYRFYRSTKKAAGYKSAITKKTTTYTNTTGKKGTKYFYKVQVRVYDGSGKLAAKTALKQCKYAARTK